MANVIKKINTGGTTYPIDRTFTVTGLSTVAGNGSSGSYLSVRWYCSGVEGLTAPYDGMRLMIKIPLTGVSTAGAMLSINGNTASEYHPLAYNKNSVLTTHYAADTYKIFVYDASATMTVYKTSNTSSTVTGVWKAEANYDSDSDNKVAQNYSTTNNNYPLLATATSGTSSTSNRGNTTSILNNNVYMNPGTGRLHAEDLDSSYVTTDRVLGRGELALVSESEENSGIYLYSDSENDDYHINVHSQGDININSGSSNYVNVSNSNLKVSKIFAPTSNGSSTYGVGTSSQVLKSNGTNCYWGSDANDTTTIGGGDVYKAKNAYGGYQVLITNRNNELVPMVSGSGYSTGTSKTMNTSEAFDPFGIYCYTGSSSNRAAGALCSSSTYIIYSSFDIRYAFNITSNLTANAPFYIVAQLQSDGTAKLASPYYSQSLPSTANGLVYILLGQATSTTNISLIPNHPIYYFANGRIYEHSGDKIPTSYVSSVNGSTGAITNVAKTNADNTFTGSNSFTGTVGNTQTAAGVYLGLDTNSTPNANMAIVSANNAAYIDIGRPNVDYDFRIIKWNENGNTSAQFCYGGNASGTITIPQATGVMALTSDIPTSANDIGAAASNHTHTTTIVAGGSGDTSSITLSHGTKYKLTAGGTDFVFTMPSSGNTNYYPIRSYTSGLQISSYSGSTNCQLYVPYATNTQAGVVSTAAQTFAGAKTFNDSIIVAESDATLTMFGTGITNSYDDGTYSSSFELYAADDGSWLNLVNTDGTYATFTSSRIESGQKYFTYPSASGQLATTDNITQAKTQSTGSATSIQMKFWQGTQAQYNSITTKDSNTLYIIKES